MTSAAAIIRAICGSTVRQAKAWSSTSAWGVTAKVRSSFWATSKGCLQTDGYQGYNKVGGPGMVHACCLAHAQAQVRRSRQGQREGSGLGAHRCADGRAVRHRPRSARPEHGSRATRCAAARARAACCSNRCAQTCWRCRRRRCPRALPGRLPTTRSRYGASSRGFSTIPSLNSRTTSPRTRCARSPSDAENWLHLGSKEAGPKVAAMYMVPKGRTALLDAIYLGAVS